MTARRIVAIELPTESDPATLGGLNRAWPVNEKPCFGSLLQALDEADQE